jgi:hypothetical protein
MKQRINGIRTLQIQNNLHQEETSYQMVQDQELQLIMNEKDKRMQFFVE